MNGKIPVSGIPAISSSDEYCNNTFDVSPPPYYNVTGFHCTDTIARIHINSPRFGKPSDINILLLESFDEEGQDYMMGAVSGSIAMAVFFAVWLL